MTVRIEIRNIGLIKEADIQLDGLTVITGMNDSGKSTVGKTLFSLYHGMNFYEQEINYAAIEYLFETVNGFKNNIKQMGKHTKKNNIIDEINDIYLKLDAIDDKLSDLLMFGFHENQIDELEDITKKIQNLLYEIRNSELNNSSSIKNFVNTLREKISYISSQNFNVEIKRNTVTQIFLNEFAGRIQNVYTKEDSYIKISDQDFFYLTAISQNKVSDADEVIAEPINFKDVTFIDTPMVINDLSGLRGSNKNRITRNHKDDLLDKLQNVRVKKNIIENTVYKEMVSEIDERINEILVGKIQNSIGKFEYEIDGEKFDLSVLASGLKSYSIIRMLLDHGYLSRESLLIIDEPEVHLHPEWQLKIAELLVLIAKELKIKMILTTHSPYFLQALNVFNKKYSMKKKTHFYLARREKSGAVLKNIDDNLDETYNLLAQPIIALKKFMDEQDENE